MNRLKPILVAPFREVRAGIAGFPGNARWLVPALPQSFGWRTLRPASWPNLALALLGLAVYFLDIVIRRPAVGPYQVAFGTIAVVPLIAIVWRPRIGVALLWLSAGSWLVTGAAHISPGGDFAVMVAIYTIASQRNWRQSAVAVGIATFGATLVALVGHVGSAMPEPSSALEAAGYVAVYLVLYSTLAGIGLWIGRRRAFLKGLVDWTAHLERERDVLEAERDLAARRAVAVERARIARELHDVVAHHVSVMVIQAGAAEAALPPDARGSAQALEAVRETGREALAEMRRLLGLLRSDSSLEAEDDGSRADSRAEMRPQPGLADLAALAERTREAGVNVTTEIVGSARKIPAGVDLSLYRVVQEALTNTLRHAGPGASACLRLTYEPFEVTVEVTDDGRGKPAVTSVEHARAGVGHGLLGMRERVSLFGGRLEAGPIAGGGFRIRAGFPLGGADSSVGESGTGVER